MTSAERRDDEAPDRVPFTELGEMLLERARQTAERIRRRVQELACDADGSPPADAPNVTSAPEGA